MKIVFSHSYDIKYAIQYFTATEGGMDSEDYGTPVNTIEEALTLLESAKNVYPKDPWIITLIIDHIFSSGGVSSNTQ